VEVISLAQIMDQAEVAVPEVLVLMEAPVPAGTGALESVQQSQVLARPTPEAEVVVATKPQQQQEVVKRVGAMEVLMQRAPTHWQILEVVAVVAVVTILEGKCQVAVPVAPASSS
jgi:hypothetical protein